MPTVDIVIKTKAELADLKKTGSELENVEKKSEKAAAEIKKLGDEGRKTGKELETSQKTIKAAGDETGRLDSMVKRAAQGFNKLGQEIPIVGVALNALKNPFTLIATAGVVAIDAIRNALKEAKDEQAAYNAAAENVRFGIEAYSDLTNAVNALMEAQKGLAEQTKSANDFIKQQIELKGQIVQGEIDILSAEEERRAALIERDTKDPVERARKLKENKLSFGARKIALRSALGKQQVEALDEQIAGEGELQVEAGASVPNEAGLRDTVRGVEQTRSELESALKINRRMSQRAGLLKLVTQLDPAEDIFTALNSGQLQQLREEGILTATSEMPQIKEAAARHLSVAGPESDRQAQVVGRLRASLRAGLGSLPAGVATEADIGPFMSTAESKAAETQNASYERMRNLMRMRDKVEFDRANQAAVGGIQNQTAGIRGDIAIGGAQESAGRDLIHAARGARGASKDANAEVLRLLKEITDDGNLTKQEIKNIKYNIGYLLQVVQ